MSRDYGYESSRRVDRPDRPDRHDRHDRHNEEGRPQGIEWLSLGLGLAGAATIAFAYAIPALGPGSATLQYLLIQGGLWPICGLAWFVAWPQVRWPEKKGAAFSRLMTFASVFALLQLAWWVHAEYRLGAVALIPVALFLALLGLNWQPRSDGWAIWMWRAFYMAPAFVSLLCVLWLSMPWPKPVAEVRQIMAGDLSSGIRGVLRWIGHHVLHLQM